MTVQHLTGQTPPTFQQICAHMAAKAEQAYHTPAAATLTAYNYNRDGSCNPDSFQQFSSIDSAPKAIDDHDHVFLSLTPNPNANRKKATGQKLHEAWHHTTTATPSLVQAQMTVQLLHGQLAITVDGKDVTAATLQEIQRAQLRQTKTSHAATTARMVANPKKSRWFAPPAFKT